MNQLVNYYSLVRKSTAQVRGFGEVVNLNAHHNLTDDEKQVLLKQHFVPAPGYNSPLIL